MPEVPPPTRVASSTVTAAPACASRYATQAPITPAPITIVFIICISYGPSRSNVILFGLSRPSGTIFLNPRRAPLNVDHRRTDPSLGKRYAFGPPSPGALLGRAGDRGHG